MLPSPPLLSSLTIIALLLSPLGLIAQEPPAPPAPIPDSPPAVAPELPTSPEGWIGQPIPESALNYVLKDSEGTEYRLADHADKTIVLEWMSIVCPFTKRHYQKVNIPSISRTYQQKGVVWFAIDSSFLPISHPVKVQKFLEERHTPHPILLDPAGTLGEMLSVSITPTLMVIHEGKVVFFGAIDDDIWGRKKERREYLMEALNAVVAGQPIAEATPRPYGMKVQYLSAENARREAIEKANEKPEEKKEGAKGEGDPPPSRPRAPTVDRPVSIVPLGDTGILRRPCSPATRGPGRNRTTCSTGSASTPTYGGHCASSPPD